MNDIQFKSLGKKERKLLLTALDIDIKNLKCEMCGKKTTYNKCGIMPPLKTSFFATILCESVICVSGYITETEDTKIELTKNEKEALIRLIELIKKDVGIDLSNILKKLKGERK